MATKVYTTEEIILQDDTQVTVKPLPIGRLRRFMDAWGKITELPEGDDGFGVFINCSGIALEKNFEDKYDVRGEGEELPEGEVLGKKYKAYLEDTLDLDTIYRILDVAGGLKLNDPKLLEAAMMAQETDLSGPTST